MIPDVIQAGPNILAEYRCSKCGIKLMPKINFLGVPAWKYCSECGEFIEWDKVTPLKWEELSCDTCGRWLIRALPNGHMQSSGNDYIGTTTCRTCLTEYCRTTNCLGCSRGNYPDCPYLELKKAGREETGDGK